MNTATQSRAKKKRNLKIWLVPFQNRYNNSSWKFQCNIGLSIYLLSCMDIKMRKLSYLWATVRQSISCKQYSRILIGTNAVEELIKMRRMQLRLEDNLRNSYFLMEMCRNYMEIWNRTKERRITSPLTKTRRPFSYAPTSPPEVLISKVLPGLFSGIWVAISKSMSIELEELPELQLREVLLVSSCQMSLNTPSTCRRSFRSLSTKKTESQYWKSSRPNSRRKTVIWSTNLGNLWILRQMSMNSKSRCMPSVKN